MLCLLLAHRGIATLWSVISAHKLVDTFKIIKYSVVTQFESRPGFFTPFRDFTQPAYVNTWIVPVGFA